MLDRDTVTEIEVIHKNRTYYRDDFYNCLKRAKSLPLEDHMDKIIDRAMGTFDKGFTKKDGDLGVPRSNSF